MAKTKGGKVQASGKSQKVSSRIRVVDVGGPRLGVSSGTGKCDCGDCVCKQDLPTDSSSVKVGDVGGVYHIANPVMAD